MGSCTGFLKLSNLLLHVTDLRLQVDTFAVFFFVSLYQSLDLTLLVFEKFVSFFEFGEKCIDGVLIGGRSHFNVCGGCPSCLG